jgi:hypothetical protein
MTRSHPAGGGSRRGAVETVKTPRPIRIPAEPVRPARWTVAALHVLCPVCCSSYADLDAPFTRIGRGGLQPGTVLTCRACTSRFRLPALQGVHGPGGKGYA